VETFKISKIPTAVSRGYSTMPLPSLKGRKSMFGRERKKKGAQGHGLFPSLIKKSVNSSIPVDSTIQDRI